MVPFYQDLRNEIALTVEFIVKGAFVDNWVVERINKERLDIEFKISMLARASFKARSWKIWS